MGETEFLGYLVMSVVTLGGFIGVIHKMTQPVNDLKVVIQELKDCVKALRDQNATHTKQLETLEDNVHELSHRIGAIETTIEIYKSNKNNIGFHKNDKII